MVALDTSIVMGVWKSMKSKDVKEKEANVITSEWVK
jgi:hypothetical protein